MEEARCRALTHYYPLLHTGTYDSVEMEEARFRALTHPFHYF